MNEPISWADDSAKGRAALVEAVRRAYALADRLQATPGSSKFLLRYTGAELRHELDSAGAELRDALDESEIAPEEVVHPEQDAQVSAPDRVDDIAAVGCSALYTRSGRDWRQCIRAARHRGDHIDEHGFHWSETVAVYRVLDLDGPLPPPEGPEYTPCTACGHIEPEHSDALFRRCLKCKCLRYSPEPPDQGPLTGIEVRDPCPYCEDCRLIPRTLMADHVREHHPEVTLVSHENGRQKATGASQHAAEPQPDDWIAERCPHCDDLFPRNRIDEHIFIAHGTLPPCTATLRNEYTDGTLHCTFRAGHWEGEFGTLHASWRGEPRARMVWGDRTPGATPHAEPDNRRDNSGPTIPIHQANEGEQADTEADNEHTRSPGYELGSNDRHACPYCPGGPVFLRSEIGAHVDERHARVLAALASGTALDELLPNFLPHEMEG